MIAIINLMMLALNFIQSLEMFVQFWMSRN